MISLWNGSWRPVYDGLGQLSWVWFGDNNSWKREVATGLPPMYIRFGDMPDKELRNFGGIRRLAMLLGKNRLFY